MDSSAASVMKEWGSHTQPRPAFCKMGEVVLLPSLENFVESKHLWVPTSEWQWPKWDVVQDLTCSRQRRCRLGLNALGSLAFPLCSSTASLAWELQAYNLLSLWDAIPQVLKKEEKCTVVWCDKRTGREQAKAALCLSLHAKVHAGYLFVT